MLFSDTGIPINLRSSVRCPSGGGITIDGVASRPTVSLLRLIFGYFVRSFSLQSFAFGCHLSVTVQAIAWKRSSSKWLMMCQLNRLTLSTQSFYLTSTLIPIWWNVLAHGTSSWGDRFAFSVNLDQCHSLLLCALLVFTGVRCLSRTDRTCNYRGDCAYPVSFSSASPNVPVSVQA